MNLDDVVQTVAKGFTERQARFLVLVARHSGVCVMRQYSTFAGIVFGQKTRTFFGKLESLGWVSTYDCAHSRARIYQRAPISRVHRVRGQEVRRASRRGDGARHPRRHSRMDEPGSELAEWWAVYRETYTPQKSTRNRDAQIVANFLPHFGARRLNEITKPDIVRYLNLRRTQLTGNPGHKKRRRISESTVRRERGTLQAICERAIEEGHDFRNPFRGIKRGKDKARTRVLTLDEEAKLLDAPHPRYQHFVRFTLGTGCRLDEIRSIDPKRDIDWTRGTVHVIGKYRKERDVPMQPDARAALEEQLEEEGRLWTQNPQRSREVLGEGCGRPRIPTLGPHALRHTFGTRWLQAGGDISSCRGSSDTQVSP